MAILKLDEHLYISPQLTEADAEQISLLGIKTVVCNRPDHEEEDNQTFRRLARGWKKQALPDSITNPLSPATSKTMMSKPSDNSSDKPNIPSLPIAEPVRAAPSCGASAERQKVCRLTKSSAAQKRQA